LNKAYIFCNNNYKDFNLNIKLDGHIIAADGGANFLYTQKITPDVIIGDLDSIKNSVLSHFDNANIFKYSSEKDESDTELAIRYCHENNYEDITIINATGADLSHSLSNIFVIEKYLNDSKFHLYNRNCIVHYVSKEIKINSNIDNKISLVPLSDSVFVTETSGLKYALNNENIYRAGSRGISNKAEDNEIFVKIKNGILLLIVKRN